ncbi:uncharacterized protein [Clytia hemisphaerica]|uniref:uncharacterized protein n=1 Tax=Clytia hemisphaerica TaxID=252671 RepID=UPI0034D42F87
MAETVDVRRVDDIQNEVTEALAYMERDFPLSLLVVSFHLLLHIAEGLIDGPIHTKWMFYFERFNSYIKRRVMSRSNPEACVMKTYRINDWVSYLKTTGHLQILFDENDEL